MSENDNRMAAGAVYLYQEQILSTEKAIASVLGAERYFLMVNPESDSPYVKTLEALKDALRLAKQRCAACRKHLEAVE